jgi:hypothetical protein
VTTLAIMKARIENEIARSDLSSEIGDAISTAIGAYSDQRFFFSESREVTFNTVVDQEAYSSTDHEALGRLNKLDYVFAMVAGAPYEVCRRGQKEIEDENLWNVSNTWPGSYSWYGEKLRLAPIPSDVWEIRIGGVFAPPAPSDDNETGNPWMTKAERLIRCRAKAILYGDVIFNAEKAAANQAFADEALRQLINRTVDLGKIDDGCVEENGYW